MSGIQMHPITAELLGNAHRADLQADARQARMAREAREANVAARQVSLTSVVWVSRRRLAATLIAAGLALGVVAGAAGAAVPAPGAAAPAVAPAPAAQYPTTGGGIHRHR